MVGRVLVANRGEVAVRLIRAIQELGGESVAVFSQDDANQMHVALASSAVPLNKRGAAAYLDVEGLVEAARTSNCSAVAPGYGFLSESQHFCDAVQRAGMTFVGASPKALSLFGNKVASRELAEKAGVPVVPGAIVNSVAELESFFTKHGHQAVMLKASHGGGGRGIREIRTAQEIPSAFERCKSEALASFESGELFVELLVENAKHLEVQVVADSCGNVMTLGERDCSLQRQHQKLIEICPCPSLDDRTRSRLMVAAVQLTKAGALEGLATMEFLVQLGTKPDVNFYFMECNPRLQVEHTITEEVWGIDLVQTQLLIACSKVRLEDLHVPKVASGFALQLRVNAETLQADGTAKPVAGKLDVLEAPRGPGIRFDSAAFAGYVINPAFDSLLGKIIVKGTTFKSILVRAERALSEFHVCGAPTNAAFLTAVVQHAAFKANHQITSTFVTEHAAQLVQAASSLPTSPLEKLTSTQAQGPSAPSLQGHDSDQLIVTPVYGEVVDILVKEGDLVREGETIAVLLAFKMEHEVISDKSGKVVRVFTGKGQAIDEGTALIELEDTVLADIGQEASISKKNVDLNTYTRPELEKLRKRRSYLDDDFRADIIKAKRHGKGRRSARENIKDIIDEGTWVEYGDLAIAHQLGRQTYENLLKKTQADGVVAGIAGVNKTLLVPDCDTSCVVLSYDYLVLAGTQGVRGHLKKDRIFALARRWSLPIILLTEGGGGRPNDFTPKDSGSAGLGAPAWHILAGLTNVRIGIGSGFNFAGNAALLGMCDIIIATRDASIAMAGPVMVEFAGLGSPDPKKLGPAPMQFENGVVDILVEDEAEATRVAKKCLSFFQGNALEWSCPDQRNLRTLIPEDRKRAYDVRIVLEVLADHESVVELGSAFGQTIVTAFCRVEGIPIGVVANQPKVLGGALDAPGCEKAAKFLQLCERFKLPVLTLCDTPGFIVGEAFEETALVKHTGKLFQVSSTLTVPHFNVILRKVYGLGGMAICGGALQEENMFTVAWPTGEAGGMGLEGAVALGFRKDLEAIKDPVARQELFDKLVQEAYDRGSAFSIADDFQIDSVIDPAETRFWITRAINAAGGGKALPRTPARL